LLAKLEAEAIAGARGRPRDDIALLAVALATMWGCVGAPKGMPTKASAEEADAPLWKRLLAIATAA
jgi:hypothetical protein